MYIAERLRQLREAKKLSQGDIEKRTGLFRCYISRVENGHTVPTVDTLEKFSSALEVPMYQIFYDGQESAPPSNHGDNGIRDWASHGPGRSLFIRLQRALARSSDRDRALLMEIATKMVSLEKGRKTARYPHRKPTAE